MFDWLGEIINGIGTSISSAFQALWTEVSGSMWNIFLKWIYSAIYTAIAKFFASIGSLGVEIFELSWVEAVLKLFTLVGWALFVAGLVVAVFDLAIEYQGQGRINIRSAALNLIKGFFAVSLFTVLPVELYKFCVTLQNTFSGDLVYVFTGEKSKGLGEESMSALKAAFDITVELNFSVFNLLAMIALAYCVIKLFFANIKRGGILLTQIAVGTLHMFSIPRGYTDGFNQWCKQVIALCLTAFMQTTLLFLGLMTFSTNMLLGLGIMLAANEVPRVAQQFGLDTSIKVNMMNVVHSTTTAVNLTRSIFRK